MEVPLYDVFSADYDRFVNWEARLNHELPFLERTLAAVEARRVLDAACGTGRHAIALAQRGYQVVGADLSAPMIQRARENAAAAGVEARFVVAGFGDLAASVGTGFDALLCLGNSLPHLLSQAALWEALTDFAAVLRPGGVLIVQNRNFARVLACRERWMPPQSYREGEEEWLFLRFYDFHPEAITFNVIILRRRGEQWSQRVESTEMRPVQGDELVILLSEAGFTEIITYGDMRGTPFDPAHSGDLVVVARRR